MQSLIASIILWIGIPVLVGLTMGNTIDLSGGALGGICAGIYALYLMIAMCCNPLLSYLGKIEHGAKFRE